MKNLNRISPLLLVTLLCIAHAPVNVLAMENNAPKLNLKAKLNKLDKMSEARSNSFYQKHAPDYSLKVSSLLNKIQKWFNDNPERKIKLNIKSENGNTLLHFVIDEVVRKIEKSEYHETEYPHKMLDFLHYILEHNANPNIQNKNKRTPFFYCMYDVLVDYPLDATSPTQEKLNKLIDLFLKSLMLWKIRLKINNQKVYSL